VPACSNWPADTKTQLQAALHAELKLQSGQGVFECSILTTVGIIYKLKALRHRYEFILFADVLQWSAGAIAFVPAKGLSGLHLQW
jgi:hypothetical protein